MTAPLVSIALPVYNGERYLRASLDSILAQTMTDFELIVSDNASTDTTAQICREYATRDPRIRYVRHPANIGAHRNHTSTIPLARGRYFKFASHDDLYEPTLLAKCVALLEAQPDVVLAHSWDAMIDEHGEVISKTPYPLRTSDPDPAVRFRSCLETPGGNDFYGVMRIEVLRRIGGIQSHHNADRTFGTALALHGPFAQVPEVLYYRRDHPDRGERARNARARATIGDTRMADRWRHPMFLLYLAYVLSFPAAVLHAPLSLRDKARCGLVWASWLLRRGAPGHRRRLAQPTDPAVVARQSGASSAPDAGTAVAALGYFGIDNFGNEASLAAFRHGLHSVMPEARLSVLGIDPAEITRIHGLPAERVMSYRARSGGPVAAAMKVLGRVRDIPRIFRLVGGVDAVVVPGMGVFESALRIPPWSLPYWLFLTAVWCRIRRRTFALVSIGVTPTESAATRFFCRWTFRLATWASVRDPRSRDLVRALGVERPIEVYPDIVFGRPVPPPAAVVPGSVGVGVMDYSGPRGASESEVRARYLEKLTGVVRRLVDDDRRVTLVVGAWEDRAIADAVATAVGRPERLTVTEATTLDDVLADFAPCEVLVTSRFHNLIAGLQLAKPMVTLGYAQKNADLLEAFGLGGLAQSISDFDPERLLAQLGEALERHAATKPRMEATLRQFLAELEEQYTRLASVLLGAH